MESILNVHHFIPDCINKFKYNEYIMKEINALIKEDPNYINLHSYPPKYKTNKSILSLRDLRSKQAKLLKVKFNQYYTANENINILTQKKSFGGGSSYEQIRYTFREELSNIYFKGVEVNCRLITQSKKNDNTSYNLSRIGSIEFKGEIKVLINDLLERCQKELIEKHSTPVPAILLSAAYIREHLRTCKWDCFGIQNYCTTKNINRYGHFFNNSTEKDKTICFYTRQLIGQGFFPYVKSEDESENKTDDTYIKNNNNEEVNNKSDLKRKNPISSSQIETNVIENGKKIRIENSEKEIETEKGAEEKDKKIIIEDLNEKKDEVKNNIKNTNYNNNYNKNNNSDCEDENEYDLLMCSNREYLFDNFFMSASGELMGINKCEISYDESNFLDIVDRDACTAIISFYLHQIGVTKSGLNLYLKIDSPIYCTDVMRQNEIKNASDYLENLIYSKTEIQDILIKTHKLNPEIFNINQVFSLNNERNTTNLEMKKTYTTSFDTIDDNYDCDKMTASEQT